MMKVAIIAVVIVLILIAYYLLTRSKAYYPLSVYGHADNEVTLFLNGASILKSIDWVSRFKWDGTASPGDKLTLEVTNIGEQAGLVCAINWNGKIIYSDPKTFQTNKPVEACGDALVSKWAKYVKLNGMEQAKWIWSNGCIDGNASRTNPVVNTFTYILP
jgi:hypothetical protein